MLCRIIKDAPNCEALMKAPTAADFVQTLIDIEAQVQRFGPHDPFRMFPCAADACRFDGLQMAFEWYQDLEDGAAPSNRTAMQRLQNVDPVAATDHPILPSKNGPGHFSLT